MVFFQSSHLNYYHLATHLDQNPMYQLGCATCLNKQLQTLSGLMQQRFITYLCQSPVYDGWRRSVGGRDACAPQGHSGPRLLLPGSATFQQGATQNVVRRPVLVHELFVTILWQDNYRTESVQKLQHFDRTILGLLNLIIKNRMGLHFVLFM